MRDVIPSLFPSFSLLFFFRVDGTTCFYREGNSMWAPREMGIFVEGTICSIDFQWLRGG